MNLRRSYRIPASGQKGSALLAAVSLVACLSIAALVVDLGILLLSRTELSKAVDAAALAGAQELNEKSGDEGRAKDVATQFVGLNLSSSRKPGLWSKVTIRGTNVVRVEGKVNPPALFSKVLGFTDFTVGAIAEATRFDPDVALIIDRSGSMCHDSHPGAGADCPDVGPWEPFNTIQATAKGFVTRMPGDSTFTLISYSRLATRDVVATKDKAVVNRGIDLLKPDDYTDIAAAVDLAIDQFVLSSTRPKLIVLLTDGVPNVINGKIDSESAAGRALETVALEAFKKGILIYGINYGDVADDALMKRVAESTEGKFYSAPNGVKLQDAYTEIAGKVHIRLTYVN